MKNLFIIFLALSFTSCSDVEQVLPEIAPPAEIRVSCWDFIEENKDDVLEQFKGCNIVFSSANIGTYDLIYYPSQKHVTIVIEKPDEFKTTLIPDDSHQVNIKFENKLYVIHL